jgi:outer membrane lipoprotein-sorting protein
MIKLLACIVGLVFLFSCASISTVNELKKSLSESQVKITAMEKAIKDGESRDYDLLRFLNQIADKYNQHLRDLHSTPKALINY